MTQHSPSIPSAPRPRVPVRWALALLLPLLPAGRASAEATTMPFTPCADEPSLECGRLPVPVSYKSPEGRTVDLAVVRKRATGPARRIGVLFAHPGGHLSGIAFIRAGLGSPVFARVNERFDIVSLDPRGAGDSQPLHCGFDLLPLPEDHGDATLAAYFDDYGRRVAAQCLDTDPEFVRSISGRNFALDIERLRRGLGEQQLTFAMFSNSGPVGAAYASLFPQRVRALLLDSPVAAEHLDYWIERRVEQGASYEMALQRIDQICRRSADCPLNATGVVAAFDQVVARLLEQPVPLPQGGSFTADAFRSTFFVLLPREDLWSFTVGALSDAVGGDLSTFIAIAAETGGTDDALVARLCNDYGTRRGAADFLPVTEAAGTLHPRLFDRFTMAYDVAMCAAWPAAVPPVIRNVANELEVPALVIHSEFDPEAPFAWGKRLAQALGMERHVVRYEGGGHGLATRDLPCVSDVVDAYLFDRKLPVEGLSCPAVVTPSGKTVAKEWTLQPTAPAGRSLR